jgi:hypothetical protein
MQRLSLVLGLLLIACETHVVEPSGGGGTGASGGSGAGVPTDCESEDGRRVCGGNNQCFLTEGEGFNGNGCVCSIVLTDNADMGYCIETVEDWMGGGRTCRDGGIIGHDPPVTCLPAEMGELFCKGGGENYVFFVDHQPFDCSPLPEPSECLSTDSLELCGDACGPCSNPGDTCYGRSPRHPYSFCIPPTGTPCSPTKACSDPERSCFIFEHPDDPVAQALAEQFGLCVERSVCEAAAAELPGGARCEDF